MFYFKWRRQVDEYIIDLYRTDAKQANLLRRIVSANSDAIAAVVAQLDKAHAEVTARITALEEAVNAGEDLSAPLAALKAAAQGLDDVVADVPPVEEPPVEEPPVEDPEEV